MPHHRLSNPSTESPLSPLDFPNRGQLKNYQPLARVSAAFIQALFQQGTAQDPFFPPNAYFPLPFFIAYALSQSPLDYPIALASLNLLYRYKSRVLHRQIKLRDPSRLYIAAYLVAAKAMSDIAYPMRTWASLAQNNYDTVELVDMEKEFCAALNWDLRINDEVLGSFRVVVNALLSTVAGTKDDEPRESGSSIPVTPELDWSFHTSQSSPASPVISVPPTTEDDWVILQGKLEQSRLSLAGLDSKAVGLENKHGTILDDTSPPSPSGSGPTKPSRKKRISDLFQGKLGISLLRRD